MLSPIFPQDTCPFIPGRRAGPPPFSSPGEAPQLVPGKASALLSPKSTAPLSPIEASSVEGALFPLQPREKQQIPVRRSVLPPAPGEANLLHHRERHRSSVTERGTYSIVCPPLSLSPSLPVFCLPSDASHSQYSLSPSSGGWCLSVPTLTPWP